MSLPWILIQYGPDGAAGPTNGTIAGPPPWVLIGYGTSGDVVIPPAVIDSFARGGGGASKKQFKKYQQAEDKFQRRKREAEEALNATLEGRPKLKNTAELGGPKVIVIDIDDDPDDYDIMMWAAQ